MAAAVLDWQGTAHWRDGRRRPCRFCGLPSFLIDGDGWPAHKVCAERVGGLPGPIGAADGAARARAALVDGRAS